jgi:hypothetical protein
MSDFTIGTYKLLLDALMNRDCQFLPFRDFLGSGVERVIVLRHDVDLLPNNSLLFATIQADRGIKGTYYFRINRESFDINVISAIASLVHEIGYHYETMDSCNGNYQKAWDEFRSNLDTFRRIIPVTTISMHGSPRSRFDNRQLWKRYDYRTLGIMGEPYFDIDFSKVAYLTDTGRRWNGSSVSVRDKVEGGYDFNFRSTKDIISNINRLPDRVMFTFHPQRWTDNPLQWLKELGVQNLKNIGKYFIVKMNDREISNR